MSDWTRSPLDLLTNISSGGTPSRLEDGYWGGDIPWATPTDITKCKTRFINGTQESITQAGLSNSSATQLPSKTLLFTSRATIGEIKISTIPMATNQGFKNIEPKHNVDVDFLYYQLLRLKNDFLRYAAGSTFLEINRRDTGRVQIPHPKDPADQISIGKVLSITDQTIEKTEALIEKYQQIKAGLMHDLFTRGIGADGKLRPPREEAPELYQETAIGWIPRDWEIAILGQYIKSNLYGPRFDSADYDRNGNVKTIRGTDFSKDGNIKYSQVPVAQLPNQMVLRHLLEDGDVIVVTTADCGLTAVFEKQDFNFIPSAYAVKYRFSEHVNPYYFKYFMQTDAAIRLVNKYVRQGTLGNLPGSDLLRFRLGFPTILEQKNTVNILTTIENKITSEKAVLEKNIKLKNGLMQDLLTGKVQVNIPSPEQAAT